MDKKQQAKSREFTISAGFILCICFFLMHGTAPAQTTTQVPDHTGSPKATLRGWEENLLLFIMDRSHNTGGTYYDRGLFRMYTHEMDPEYQTDLFTYRFSYFEDYQWYQASQAYRTNMGSINTPDFAISSILKNTISMGEKGLFSIQAHQQEDRRAQRLLFRIGYRHTLGDAHQIGFTQTLTQKKPDIDGTLYYRYGDSSSGYITAGLTLLDWFNNIVSDVAIHRKSDYDVRHIYSRQPFLYTLRLESPQLGIFRGEATAGVQTQSRATVNRREFPDEDYNLLEWTHYQGVLLEAEWYGVTAGVIFQRTFARMERSPAEDSEYELDFGNRQRTLRGGIYATWQWHGLGFEQWFWVERNNDTQFDDNPEAYLEQNPDIRRGRYPFFFKEVHRWNKSRIFYRHGNRGIRAYIEHNGDWRDIAYEDENHPVRARDYRSYYHNQIVSRTERITLSLGYQFSQDFWFEFGASYDLDGDLVSGNDRILGNRVISRFDGGFGRIFLSW